MKQITAGGITPNLVNASGVDSWGNLVQNIGIASREELNSVAKPADAQQAAIAGAREIIPLVYGMTRIGARIPTGIGYQGDLLLLAVYGYGPVEAIDQVYFGNDPVPAGVTVTTYLGTAGQTVDPTLAAAFAAIGQSYTDALPYIAYQVYRIPPGLTTGWPNPSARVKGRKLYDPRSGTTVWSDCPALALADFITNTTYGMKLNVDWSSVTTVANLNDALLSGEKTRTINLAMLEARPGEQWLSALRTYASCFCVQQGGTIKLVADAVAGSVKSFTADSIMDLSLRKRSASGTPEVVEVIYMDTSTIPYRDSPEPARAGTGDRLSQIRLPGIDNYAEANRAAIERKNEFVLNDLEGDFTAFDDAAGIEIGDNIDLTHPIGLSAKIVRVTGIDAQRAGRYRISFREYDPAKYSTAVATAPTYPDTDLSSPTSPSAPTALVLEEEVYQVEAYGGYASRIHASWTPVDYPFLLHYWVDVMDGGDTIWSGPATSPVFRTGAIQEGRSYTVNVYAISTIGVPSVALSDSITAQGKALVPGDVPTLVVYEVGGDVYMRWGRAADIDIRLYEVRYGETTGSFATAQILERIDALTKVSSDIPPGTWRVYVVAEDSVGQQSANPIWADVTVTLDDSAFLIDNYSFVAPTTQYMTLWSARPLPTQWYTTDFGDGVGYGADNPDNGTGTFGDSLVNVPFCSPHSTGTTTGISSWVSDVWDVGAEISGTWQADWNVVNHVGTAIHLIETSIASSTGPWTTSTGTSAKQAGRWARITAYGTGAFSIGSGPTLRVDAVPRLEEGYTTTNATGATPVSLTNEYIAAKSINITPTNGTSAVSARSNNVIVGIGTGNSFDIYTFNSAGAQISADVYWAFRGIT